MRKGDGAVNGHAIAAARTPHGAGEIAKPVGREQSGTFKRRNEKAAGQMSEVMLDAMELGREFFGGGIERPSQRFGDTGELGQNLDAFARKRGHAQGVKKFGAKACVGIARHGDVMDVGKWETSFLQTIADSLRGEARGVLDAIETFFFDSGDEPA